MIKQHMTDKKRVTGYICWKRKGNNCVWDAMV